MGCHSSHHDLSWFPTRLPLGLYSSKRHIIQATILVGALYFGFSKKPWLSALLFAVGAFDPRGALLALPLLLWYNRQKLWKFGLGAVAFLAAFNLPFFFYSDIGMNFLRTEVNGDIASQIYGYDLVPMFAVATLTILEVITVIDRKTNFSFLIENKFFKRKQMLLNRKTDLNTAP